MPRTARTISSTGIYHVVIRGADRQQIFLEQRDYRKYLDLLGYYKSECNFKLYAYCLMDNHIHLLIHTHELALESIFRRLSTAYATWFNMKYDRTGFLQQGRYYSEAIETESYLYNAIKYIHFNPVKASLESYPGECYPWSSFSEYKSGVGDLTDISYILDAMGGAAHFLLYHSDGEASECLDIHNMRRRLPDDVAADLIQEYCHWSTSVDFQKLSLTEKKKYILLLHKKGLSNRQLNRLTGTPVGFINKAIASNHV